MNSSFSVESKPLAIIQVNLKDHQEKIPIYKNDNVEEVALRFCNDYDIDESLAPHIIKLIQSEIIKNTKLSAGESKSTITKTEQISKPQAPQIIESKTMVTQRQNNRESEPQFQNQGQVEKQKNMAQNYENWQKLIRQKQNENEKHRKLVSSNSSKSGPLPQNLNIIKQPVMIQNGFQKISKETEKGQSLLTNSRLDQGANFRNDQYSFKQFRQSLKKSNNTSPKPQSRSPVSRLSKSSNRDRSSKFKSTQPQKKEKSTSPLPDKILTQFLNRQEASQKKNQQTIKELRHQQNRLVDTQTGQRYFIPKISKDSFYAKVCQKVNAEDLELTNELLINYKMNKKLESNVDDYFKQIQKCDITQNQILSNTYEKQASTITSQSRNSNQRENYFLSEEQLKDIFIKLDKNNDGYISAKNLSLDLISNNQLEEIQELLFDLDENQIQYSLDSFLNAYNLKKRDQNINKNQNQEQQCDYQFNQTYIPQELNNEQQIKNDICEKQQYRKPENNQSFQKFNPIQKMDKNNLKLQKIKEISEEQEPQQSKEIPRRYLKLLSQLNV